jgi:hypothetical protein
MAAVLLRRESQMRWSSRRDGAVTVYDTDTTDDMLIIEPIIVAFTPDGWCDRCGGTLSVRRATDGTSEIQCLCCHHVCVRFNLGTRVHG